MKPNALIQDMTEGDVSKQLVTFAVPMMLANLLQIVYGLLDMVVVGRFNGSVGLAAVSNGADVIQVLTVLSIGFASAGQVLVSRCVGSGDMAGLRRLVGTMLGFFSAASLAMTVVCLLAGTQMLNALQVPAEAMPEAKRYLSASLVGLFFVFGYNSLAAALRGMGESRSTLSFMVAATLTNLVLDLLLVGAFGMGAAGAALATVVSQGVSFVLALRYLARHGRAIGFELRLRMLKIDGRMVRQLLALGAPLAFQNIMVSLSRMFVSSSINAYGLTASNVNGIGGKIGMCAAIVTNGFGSAAMTMTGQNHAAGRMDRIRRILVSGTFWGLGYAAILSIPMLAFPEAVFGMFNNDPAVLAMSRDYAIIAVLNFLGFAVRSPMLALMNGLGRSRLSMVLGVLDGVVVRIGLAIWLGDVLGLGMRGFWYGSVAASFVPFLGGAAFYFSGSWKQETLMRKWDECA